MEIKQVTITPRLAEEWLLKNTHNRPLRNGYVDSLVREIEEKRWRDYTGDTIRFDTHGRLLDGQHRLHAVILSNMSIKSYVAFGVDPNVMDVIDTGLKRQGSDVLALAGVKNAVALAGIIKYVRAKGQSSTQVSQAVHTANREIREIYNNDAIFWDNTVIHALRWYNEFRVLTVTLFGGLFAVAVKESKHSSKVMKFFDILSTGIGEGNIEVILALRKKLINNQAQTGRKYTPIAKRELIQTHFNGWIKGQKTPYASPDRKWL